MIKKQNHKLSFSDKKNFLNLHMACFFFQDSYDVLKSYSDSCIIFL